MALYLTEDGSYFWLEDESGFLELEHEVEVPFIASTTSVFTPTLDNTAKARITQIPVEVITQGRSSARITQVPVEIVVQIVASGQGFRAYIID